MSTWSITAPTLTDEERDQVTRPGGFNPDAVEPTDYARSVFQGLQLQSHIYGGTVPPEVVADRRRRNRVARRSRRINRQAAKR